MDDSKTGLGATALLALATLAAAAPAAAGQGQIDSFGASATSVTAGSEVQFWVSYSVTAAADQWGGSNPFEPAPEEGMQYWDINWYSTQFETITSITLDVGGQSQTDYPGVPAGSSAAGGMNFSMVFDQPGSYTITAAGSWSSWVDSYTSNESAYRYCWYNDPDQLTCDSWTYQYYDYTDSYSGGGGFSGQQLTIDVLAVPEPATLALWAAGLAALAWRRGRGGRSWG